MMNKKREALRHESKGREFIFRVCLPFLFAILCFGVTLILQNTDTAELVELRLYDARIKTHGIGGKHFPDSNIVIIALDEDSYEAIKEPSLLWLIKYTRILKSLNDAGAKVVGFDLVLQKTADDFVRYGIEYFMNQIDMDEKTRVEFMKFVQEYTPCIDCRFGTSVRDSRAVIANYMEEESGNFINPNKEITLFAGKENIGSALIYADIDGVIRSISPYWTDRKNESYFSFPFLIAGRYLGNEGALRNGDFLNKITFDDRDRMLINYLGPAKTFRHVSFAEVQNKAAEDDRDYFEKGFRGKIVLIGSTALASQDLKKTPFEEKDTLCPGVEVQANAINTILHRDYIKKLPAFWTSMIILLIVILVFLIGSSFILVRAFLIALLLGIFYWYVACDLFCHANLWINCTGPFTAILITLLSSYVYRYIVVEREKSFVKKALHRYISPSVAEEILKRPEMVRLGGEEREITVLFTDINSFTTLSESREPEEIMTVLNEYFTLMEEIIFKHGGTLNKFVGDEIMVIFGAPASQQDHRVRAVETSLDMREALKKWQDEREARGKFHFSIKMGIHSGKVVIGNVGSPHRAEYTAIGDTVNTASRIMGINKLLGTDILISDAVCDDTPGFIEVRDEGSHQVKGKDQKVRIFSVIGRKGET